MKNSARTSNYRSQRGSRRPTLAPGYDLVPEDTKQTVAQIRAYSDSLGFPPFPTKMVKADLIRALNDRIRTLSLSAPVDTTGLTPRQRRRVLKRARRVA